MLPHLNRLVSHKERLMMIHAVTGDSRGGGEKLTFVDILFLSCFLLVHGDEATKTAISTV